MASTVEFFLVVVSYKHIHITSERCFLLFFFLRFHVVVHLFSSTMFVHEGHEFIANPKVFWFSRQAF